MQEASAERRLAAPRLSDQGDALPSSDREIHPLNGQQHPLSAMPAAQRELLRNAGGLKEGLQSGRPNRGWRHRTVRRLSICRIGGSVDAQSEVASAQRGWKAQPSGRWRGLGTDPGIVGIPPRGLG